MSVSKEQIGKAENILKLTVDEYYEELRRGTLPRNPHERDQRNQVAIRAAVSKKVLEAGLCTRCTAFGIKIREEVILSCARHYIPERTIPQRSSKPQCPGFVEDTQPQS